MATCRIIGGLALVVAVAACETPRDPAFEQGPSYVTKSGVPYTARRFGSTIQLVGEYSKYYFFPSGEFGDRCISYAYEIADEFSGGKPHALGFDERSVVVRARRNEMTGIQSCTIRMRFIPPNQARERSPGAPREAPDRDLAKEEKDREL